MDPLSHAAIRELLPRYAAHQLTPSERATVERHTATCANCRVELGEWLTLGEWLAEDEATIPLDTGAARGLAAIHARLGQPSESDGFERSALSTMSNQDSPRDSTDQGEALPSPHLSEKRPLTGLSGGAPLGPYQPRSSQRRIHPVMAGASVAVFLALVASLFYLLAPQSHLRNNVATQPTTTGTWHVSASAPAHTSVIKFAPTAPQIGYLCAGANPLSSPSALQWLYKTTDGGMAWRPLSGVTIPSVSQSVSMRCAIFVDSSDANDVFVQLLLSRREGEPQVVSETLWRSRDGGSSWRQMPLPWITNGWVNLVVIGSRIVALAAYDQQVPPICATDSSYPYPSYPHQLDYLYATDNGGATWIKIGQSLTSLGASIIATGTLTNAGSTLFVQTYCDTTQGASSGGQYANWKSTDGGVTWSKTQLPSGAVYIQGFTRTRSEGYTGVAISQGKGTDGSPPTILPVVFYSADSGASWKALPSLSGMPGLHPVPRYTDVVWAIALSDGSVLVAVNVFNTGFAIISSGLFAIDPQGSNPTWRRYAAFDNQELLDISATSRGSVLWALYFATDSPVGYLSPLP